MNFFIKWIKQFDNTFLYIVVFLLFYKMPCTFSRVSRIDIQSDQFIERYQESTCHREKILEVIKKIEEQDIIKEVIYVGIVVEWGDNGFIGGGTADYFLNLYNIDLLKNEKYTIVPVILNSMYLERPEWKKTIGDTEIKKLTNLVKNDLQKLDAVVIPGDMFKFAPILKKDNMLESIYQYNGSNLIPENQETIYGVTLSEFKSIYPNESTFNPDPQSLKYEATIINEMNKSDRPLMASCHGAQLYAILNGVTLKAGIKNHFRTTPEIIIQKDSMIFGLLGHFDNKTIHMHSMAVDEQSLGKDINLEVVGRSEEGEVVEYMEQKFGSPRYILQPHPEFTPEHPILQAFVKSIIQRHKKKAMHKELLLKL